MSRWIDEDSCDERWSSSESESECASEKSCGPDPCLDNILHEMNDLARVAYRAKRTGKFASNNSVWSSNNFSNYASSNGMSNWNYGSNTAGWCSNNFSNYAPSNGMSNWNYGSNTAGWCSNNFSNYALSNGQSNWNYGSNTAWWASNALKGYPLVLHEYDSVAPRQAGNTDNLGNFVEVIKDPGGGDIYFVDMHGVAKMVYSPYASNVGTWSSNNFSNYALSNGQSNWDYASNSVTWLSNNLPVWTTVPTDPPPTGNPMSMYGKFTFNASNSNIYFVDYNGKAIRIEGPYASNTAAFGSNTSFFASNTAVFASNTAFFSSNTAVFASNTAFFGSNTSAFASNTAMWLSNNLPNWSNVSADPVASNNPASTFGSFTYNTSNGSVFYIDYTGKAVQLEGRYASNTAAYASNTSLYASNTSTWLSNNLPNWSNVVVDPLASGNPTSMYGTFTHNTANGNTYYVDYTGRAVKIEDGFASNTSVNASNLAAWLSNSLANWSNVVADPLAAGNPSNMYGTYTYNTSNKNIFYVDYVGRAVQVEGAYASNTSAYGSNVATWLSNNLPIWSNVGVDPLAAGNPVANYGTFTYNTSNGNIFYTDYAGRAVRIESIYASNTSAYGSNTAAWLSNNLPVWSNVITNPPATGNAVTNYGTFTCNTTNGDVYFIDVTGRAGKIESSYASNTAAWLSNNLPIWSNVTTNPPATGNTVTSYGTFTCNTTNGDVYFIDVTGRAGKIETSYASNTASWLSNNLPVWSNVSTNPPATGNSVTSYGTFTSNTTNGDVYFIDITGRAGKIESSYASNTAAWLSNNLPVWSNVATNPPATGNTVTSYGTFTCNTTNGDVYFIDVTGRAGKIESSYASNTSTWLSNNFSPKDWDWASNTADWLVKHQGSSTDDYWLYPVGKNYTYTMCNVGIGNTVPNQALDVVGNAEISGSVYVNIASGGSVYLRGATARAGTAHPTYGIGTDPTSKVTGVSGDEVWLYHSDGVILKTVADSNSTYAYPDAALNQGANPAYYDGTDSIEGAPCPTVWISCNLRIPGNCAVNTVNAWSYCGHTALIQTMCNNNFFCSNGTIGSVYSDNYKTTNGMAFTSDRRLKKNIIDADLDICYSNIQNLRLRYYKWSDAVGVECSHDRHRVGWIAQEVGEVFPKSVKETEQHGLADCLSMNQDQIIAAMYGTVQKLQIVKEEHQAAIQSLQIEIEEMGERDRQRNQEVLELKTMVKVLMNTLATPGASNVAGP
jgi:hypothetical protein